MEVKSEKVEQIDIEDELDLIEQTSENNTKKVDSDDEYIPDVETMKEFRRKHRT